jgi:hypothetical protein
MGSARRSNVRPTSPVTQKLTSLLQGTDPPTPSFAQHAVPAQGDKQHHPRATHLDADKGLKKAN